MPLGSRVLPEYRERANAIADACGTSWGQVLERIIEQIDLDPATGRPVWWDMQDAEEVQHRLVS